MTEESVTEKPSGLTEIQREPYAVILDWKHAHIDEDAPYMFGPYFNATDVEAARKMFDAYMAETTEEEQMTFRVGTFKYPDMLRMFLFL